MSHILRRVRPHAVVDAPVADPRDTLDEIRAVARRVLPGVVIARRLMFRYTLVWSKP